ncbi:MAG: SusC/RagA family TonB-linked outer membrane protein [Bacteroidales bacterium]|nr:SusC/RagA family TonB-linked outer membrane protein [Bacteroidales bacterium]
MKRRLKIITLLGVFLLTGAHILQAQRTITGTVIDVGDKQGIPGVQVVVKGTTIGTTTNIMGQYSLGNVPNDATHLEFSFMGMKTQEAEIGGLTTIDMVMEQDAQTLETFEIVTYGSARKVGTAVGSAQQVTSAQLQARPVGNVMDALQGQVAGLAVSSNSGDPSENMSVRLHGNGSLFGASSEPLYIMDGMQVSANTIMAMNQNDFESVTTLKDASATAIYGSRAANGVIVYMTKRGQRNQNARVTLRSQYGISKLANRKFYDNFMSSQELADFYSEIDPANFLQRLPEFDLGVNTKWLDVYMRDNVPTAQTDLSVSGGSEKTMYFVSGGHFKQEGTAHGSDYERFTVRTNIESQAKDWLKIGLNGLLSRDNRSSNQYYGSANLSGGLSFLYQPWFNPVDSAGNRRDWMEDMQTYHPEYIAENYFVENVNTQINGSFFVEIEPIKGLKIINRSGSDARDYYSWGGNKPSSLLDGVGVGTFMNNRQQVVTMTTTNTIEYAFKLQKDHSISILGGQEGTLYNYNQTAAEGSELFTDRLWELDYANPANRLAISGLQSYANLSFLGRVDYAYKERFYGDFTLRNDASSRFGKNNRNAMFWSIGGMWDMTNEDFVKAIRPITEAKLRASYGTSGNSAIDNYEHRYLFGSSGESYNKEPTFSLITPGNADLAWEKQTQLTVTASAQFLKKYNVELSFYQKERVGMLFSVPYPHTTGIGSLRGNVGTYRNTGADLTLGLNIIQKKDYYFSVNANLNYNYDKVMELFNGFDRWELPNSGMAYVVGSPVMYYYPIFARIDKQNGKATYYRPGSDVDKTTTNVNNVTQTFSASDLRQNTGIRMEPAFTGGFGLSGGWKGITVVADFAFVLGKHMIDNTSWFAMNPREIGSNNGYLNQSRDVLDYWKAPGDDARFPNWKSDDASTNRLDFSTFFLDNASYLRMKNLTISYNFERSLVAKTNFLTSAKVFLTTRNLLTLTNYMGIDPEVDANIATGTYGNSKQIQVGVELQF